MIPLALIALTAAPLLSAVAPQSLPGAALLGGTALAAPGQAWRLAQADDQGADAERPAHRPGTAEAPSA